MKINHTVATILPVSILPLAPPGKLDILGKKFKVLQMPTDNTEDHDGLMELSKQEIWYRSQEALSYNQDTVLHETVHAIDEVLQLGLKEKQVHQLAAALLAVIKHNPKFINWLLTEAD
jgi:hypothetical protein